MLLQLEKCEHDFKHRSSIIKNNVLFAGHIYLSAQVTNHYTCQNPWKILAKSYLGKPDATGSRHNRKEHLEFKYWSQPFPATENIGAMTIHLHFRRIKNFIIQTRSTKTAINHWHIKIIGIHHKETGSSLVLKQRMEYSKAVPKNKNYFQASLKH
jgi:hypothetical protein